MLQTTPANVHAPDSPSLPPLSDCLSGSFSRQVLRRIRSDVAPGLADARRLLTRLHDTGAGTVSTRSAMRLVSSFKTAEQAHDAIHTLLTYGWLQKTPSDGAPHTGRPPAPEYTVVHSSES
jgi:hypothetical protein